jgi:hypothetical protein
MSRGKDSILFQALIWLVVAGGSVVIALLLFEVMMQHLRQDRVAMRVTPYSYGVLDENLGVRYEPDISISFAYLDAKGRVLECLNDISVTNSDGFRGLDKKHDYREATQRIIVTGDSFSHWNNDGLTLVDYTKAELNQQGFDASLLNVAGGTFGLEHMLVHIAAAIDETGPYAPDLVAIQFIRDDITRGWWYLDTVSDRNGRLRARLGRSLECLAPDSGCGSDEYLIEKQATQEWCLSRKGTGTVDDVSRDLVSTYRDIRGFFVYVRKAFARLGIIDRQATSVIPRVVSIEDTDTARIRRAIEAINASGAKPVFVYLPTVEEIRSRKIYSFDENENAVLRFYEESLGVPVVYPADFAAFDGITEFAISPADGHPSVELQRGYGRYLGSIFADALR